MSTLSFKRGINDSFGKKAVKVTEVFKLRNQNPRWPMSAILGPWWNFIKLSPSLDMNNALIHIQKNYFYFKVILVSL